MRQVEQDRLALSDLAGYEVVGMAYPGGRGPLYDERVVRLVKEHTGIRYARAVKPSGSFDVQTELLTFQPTIHHHHHHQEMMELAERFLSMKADTPQIFYIWDHAYEFDISDEWAEFEEFCRYISGRSDVFYGTNREVLLPEEYCE